MLARCEGDDIDNALSEQFDSWLDSSFWPAMEKKLKADGAASAGQDQSNGKTLAQARRLERLRKQGEIDAARAEAAAAGRQLASEDAAPSGANESSECCGGSGESNGECCRGKSAAPASAAAEAGKDECCGGDKEGGECCRSNGGSGGGGFDSRGEDWPLSTETQAGGGGASAVPLPFESDEEESEHGSDGGYGSEGGAGMVDVEDLGSRLVSHGGGEDGVGGATGGVGNKRVDAAVAEAARKPMVTASLAKSLGKQGYKIVGTHSGVKLCRWTKAMLRGRGGCYKHVLRHRELSVHGNHTVPRLRQQVRLLLAPSRQPGGDLLPLAGGSPTGADRRLRGGPQADD